ncbi:MAG: AMP-binding protein [Burkholderiaceae bacterium]|nr:AMP-binding protein [Burkholderiaceae bacterium]
MSTDLRDWAARDPSRPAIVVDGETVGYGELEARANRLARLIGESGLARGDHVAAILGNGWLSLAMAWAAWRAGVYFTPIANSLSAVDALKIVRDCEARLLIVDGHHRELALAMTPALGNEVQRYAFGPAIANWPALEDRLAALAATPRDDEVPGALMLYTSGTTGAPKGVWRPLPDPAYRGTPTFAGDLLALFGLDEHTRYLSTAPLYHAAPLRFSLAVTACGGTVWIMRRFDAREALRLLEQNGITHSQWVPTMMQRLLALPVAERDAFHAPAHRIAIHAAAPCPVPVKRAMIDWWGPILLEYYSGSEGVGLTLIDSHEWLQRPGSVGRAYKGTIQVVDDAFEPLPSGQTGNVYFSGVPAFRYFKADEKTAARTSPQGWQTLGDVGWVDTDGYLYLTDRQDDMIISGGVNLYPQEIEAALLESPLVADCGVVGVPDADFGERAVAFVVPAPGAGDDPAARDALDAWCLERLGRVKRPGRIEFVADLPYSPTGKLLRRELRARRGT